MLSHPPSMIEPGTIHIDYEMLTELARSEAIDAKLVRQAKGIFGRKARMKILKILDSRLRSQAAQIAQRQINPMLLYEAGQRAVLDAIALYRAGERQEFHKFADALVQPAMFSAKMKRL